MTIITLYATPPIRVELLAEQLTAAGLIISFISEDGRVGIIDPTAEDLITAQSIIDAHDPAGLTAEEQGISDARAILAAYYGSDLKVAGLGDLAEIVSAHLMLDGYAKQMPDGSVQLIE